MIQKLLFILILTFITIVSNCQCNKHCKSEEDYYCTLRTMLNSEKPVESIEVGLLEEILPNTKTEFTKFYSFYCDTITKSRFELIDKRIGNLAYRDEQRFLELYINMAEYIDASTVNQAYLENYYYE